MKRPSYRWTLADTMIIVAAIGLGLALARNLYREFAPPPPRSNRWTYSNVYATWFHLIYPAITPLTIAIPFLALRPRPRLRRLFRQPGLAACLVASTTFGVLIIPVPGTIYSNENWANLLTTMRFWHEFSTGAGYSVIAVWVLLALQGAWRRPGIGLNRVGVLLGSIWALAVAMRVLNAVAMREFNVLWHSWWFAFW